jgi:dynein heavy chain
LRRSKEKHDLGEQRSHLVVTSATNSRKLKEIEDEILRVLDDENSNEVLSTSVALSNEISKKQKITQETEWEIDVTRQGYMPVAKHTSVLFFCTMDLGHLDPAYQYSLNWSILLWRGSETHARCGGPRVYLDTGSCCVMYRPARNVSRVGSTQQR